MDAIHLRSRTKVTSELLSQCPTLKVIGTATSGFDHVDLEACDEKGVAVYHCPEANRESAAQLTMGLMIDVTRQVSFGNHQLRSEGWRQNVGRGIELFGKTVGIVGLGLIGKRVAELCNAFGMQVIAYDPYLEQNQFAEAGAKSVSFEDLLKSSDVVSLHVPLTSKTRHMISVDTVSLMKKGSYLVNAARGKVVSEEAVIKGLDEGIMAGVALDVFESEPLPSESKLRDRRDQVVVTAHVGGYAQQAFEKASMLAAQRIALHIKGENCPGRLPLTAGWVSDL
ncbi:MAG: hydroxyacid dehydrogenase [Bdellovibrionales bacterium]|nr:hydroxyacid dehydrogenase [Bdellovibrionales bacterium]